MTTKVSVEAHCPPDIQVRVQQTGGEDVILQDGMEYEEHVHDDRRITVFEELAGTDGSEVDAEALWEERELEERGVRIQALAMANNGDLSDEQVIARAEHYYRFLMGGKS